jgi:hypothetical protein
MAPIRRKQRPPNWGGAHAGGTAGITIMVSPSALGPERVQKGYVGEAQRGTALADAMIAAWAKGKDEVKE